MNLLSAKQISALWGISSRRVAKLAENGRIEGAVKIGRSWMIPENAEKPGDARRDAEVSSREDKYIFPYILYSIHGKEPTDRFSPDEKALYHADCLYESGKFEKCIEEAHKLLQSTNNKYIRMGVLYVLTFAYLTLSDYENADKFSLLFTSEFYANTDHREELELFIETFYAEILSAEEYTRKTVINYDFKYSDEILPFIFLHSIVTEIVKSYYDHRVGNIVSYEMICEKIEREGYFYCSMLIHCYISMMCSMNGDVGNEYRHLRRALDIAIEHDCYVSLLTILEYSPDSTIDLLKEYPKEIREKCKAFMSRILKARTGYTTYCGYSNILSRLTEDDIVLISYCLKNYSAGKIAELLSLSESGAKKRLASLYRKCNVDNKKELKQKYHDAVGNIGRKRKSMAK